MACMDHECLRPSCKHQWANNKRESECPMCGYPEVTNWFDEHPEYEDFDEEFEDE